MSCSNCFAKYGLLKKEYGCANCGFSFCNKCLGHKAVIPRLHSANSQSVCRKCHEKLTQPQSPHQSSINPTGDETTMNQSPPIRMKLPTTEPPVFAFRQNSQEQDIADRLNRLKKQKSGINRRISQDEIEIRLAKLKDMDPSEYTAADRRTSYQPPDNRTATQKTGDLINQLQEEVSLDNRLPNPEEEIAQRLARLRGEAYVPDSSKSERGVDPRAFLNAETSDMESESSMNRNQNEIEALIAEAENAENSARVAMKQLSLDQNEVIQKALADASNKRSSLKKKDSKKLSATTAEESMQVDQEEESGDEEEDERQAIILAKRLEEEADLEERLAGLVPPKHGAGNDFDKVDSDELPWCCICNEDATLRCLGCDGDLFCKNCYREGHDPRERIDHPTKKYVRPRQETEV